MADDSQGQSQEGLLSEVTSGISKVLPYALPAVLGAALGGGGLAGLVGAAGGVTAAEGGAAQFGLQQEEANLRGQALGQKLDVENAQLDLKQQQIDINQFKALDSQKLHQAQAQNLQSLEKQRTAIEQIQNQKLDLESKMVNLKGASLTLAKQRLDSYNRQLDIAQANFQRNALMGSVLTGTLLQRSATPLTTAITGYDPDANILNEAAAFYNHLGENLPGMNLAPFPGTSGSPSSSSPSTPTSPAAPTSPSDKLRGSAGKAPRNLWGKTVEIDGKRYLISKDGVPSAAP